MKKMKLQIQTLTYNIMKISTNISLSINKDLLGQLKLTDDKFVVQEPYVPEEPKMQILEKPKTNNANSVELF